MTNFLFPSIIQQLREEAQKGGKTKKNYFQTKKKESGGSLNGQLSVAENILKNASIVREPDLSSSKARTTSSNKDGLEFVEELYHISRYGHSLRDL